MRELVLSEPARRVVNSFSAAHAVEFDAILDAIDAMLPVLRRAHLVESAVWFGFDGERYFDSAFPYIILFNVAETQPVIAVELILPAAI